MLTVKNVDPLVYRDLPVHHLNLIYVLSLLAVFTIGIGYHKQESYGVEYRPLQDDQTKPLALLCSATNTLPRATLRSPPPKTPVTPQADLDIQRGPSGIIWGNAVAPPSKRQTCPSTPQAIVWGSAAFH